MARSERLLVKQGTMKRQTDAAWLVDLDDHGEEWLPKSQCTWNDDGSWSVPEWLAELKEIG